VSVGVPAPEVIVTGLLAHEAVTPAGSPVTVIVKLPLYAVLAVKESGVVALEPCTTGKFVQAAGASETVVAWQGRATAPKQTRRMVKRNFVARVACENIFTFISILFPSRPPRGCAAYFVKTFRYGSLARGQVFGIYLRRPVTERQTPQTSARQLQRKTLLSRWKAAVAWSGSALSVSNMAEKLATAAQQALTLLRIGETAFHRKVEKKLSNIAAVTLVSTLVTCT
jgi:hypothetical protein